MIECIIIMPFHCICFLFGSNHQVFLCVRRLQVIVHGFQGHSITVNGAHYNNTNAGRLPKWCRQQGWAIIANVTLTMALQQHQQARMEARRRPPKGWRPPNNGHRGLTEQQQAMQKQATQQVLWNKERVAARDRDCKSIPWIINLLFLLYRIFVGTLSSVFDIMKVKAIFNNGPGVTIFFVVRKYVLYRPRKG